MGPFGFPALFLYGTTSEEQIFFLVAAYNGSERQMVQIHSVWELERLHQKVHTTNRYAVFIVGELHKRYNVGYT